jgi:DNA-directed RNA polymerase
LIGKNLINAKYYLRKHIPKELYNSTIVQFGEYTLEAILIYTLGVAFHSIQENSVVRVSTLLGLIDRIVITQANIINKNKMTSSRVDSSKEGDISHKKGKEFEIGRRLLDLMIERNLISLESISADDNQPVVKKKGKAYIEKHLFVVCNFDLSILPLKFNLPMVCKPLDWEHPSESDDYFLFYFEKEISKPFVLSDLKGGYLSSPSLNIHYGLLSSHNLNNFNIELDDSKYKEMCSILNGLQNQGFQINKKVLEFIKKNRPTFEKMGLLMPGILARVNLKEAFDLLRKSFYQNKAIEGTCSLDALLKELSIRVQKARYEDFIITLASAYEDYVFYLPAFMDFRGRIYRSGILHFHERDLSKALIVFANNLQEEEGCKESVKDIVATSAAFKYKKFYLYDDALQWYKEKQSLIYASDESLISFAKGASDPFQFIAKVLCDDVVQEYNKIPITQDASASAYQIMSYLLLNEEMAMRTNLIPHPDGKIQDVYTYLLQDFKEFMHHRINDKEKMEIIESKLDRKLIKLIFMPLIYGKTLISIEKDIRITYGQLLSRKDTYNLAKLSDSFWIHKYPDIVNLMKLINIVSWFCSAKDRALFYSIPFFTTKQDYMAFKKESISVYERSTKKRRKATLSIPTTKRDKRKTQSATCANFIHQKDAYIAMKVVQSLLNQHVDIYTVHDNFIPTPPYVKVVPDIYTKVFINMGHPLKIINHFFNQNLIIPEEGNYISNESIPFTSDYLKDFFNSISPAKDKKK